MDIISLGIGSPASIPMFLTFGLGQGVVAPIEADIVTVDGLFARSVLVESMFARAVTTEAMFTREVTVTVER